MNAKERSLFLKLAWFAPDTVLLGAPVRPLSLLSREAIRLMGLKCLNVDPGYKNNLEELAEVVAYRWLHDTGTDINEIGTMLWSGDWRDIVSAFPVSAEADVTPLLAEWRVERERVLRLLEATSISVKAKPPEKSSGKATPIPKAVVSADIIGLKMATLLRETGMSREEVGWLMPLPQANQIWHAALRRDGNWTIWARDENGAEGGDEKEFEGSEDWLNAEAADE